MGWGVLVRSLHHVVVEVLVEKHEAEWVPPLTSAALLQLLLMVGLHLWVCQVGEVCGGRDWDGV